MGFESYHPTMNFLYFVGILLFSICFNQPIFLTIGYFCAFIYSIKLNGKRAVFFNFLLIPSIVAYGLFYAGYNHFGITPLSVNVIGNQITLESLVYGLVLAIKIATIFMWFSCIFTIFSSDKIIYLVGGIMPKMSLMISIMLRTVPAICAYTKKVALARKSIGKGLNQGNILRRIRNLVSIISIVITWTMERFLVVSESMKSRGYTLKGRTAFSIYRFDNRDRTFVITVFWCFTLLLMGMLLDQTKILYNPQIIMNKITPFSFLFYAGYLFVGLLPFGLQVMGEWRFKKCWEKNIKV